MLSSFIDAHPFKLVLVLIFVEATAPLTKHYTILVVVPQPFASLRPLTVEALPFRGWRGRILLLEASACVVSPSNPVVGE